MGTCRSNMDSTVETESTCAAPSEASAEAGASSEDASTVSAPRPEPVACIVIGMAGSGKTTLMQGLDAFSHTDGRKSYLINLDPAVLEVPFNASIDIRDTVNYKQVMKQYSLGPNGGILTSLNLFATRFDQVLKFAEKRAAQGELDHIFLDTPGQIEIFTWSASGSIVTELLASSFPTVLIYVVDTCRCQSAITFMSNMLYACSIMYKMKLPMVLAFNKTDVVSHETCMKWMVDCDAFQDALQEETSYLSDLCHSQSLVLDEFYQTLKGVGVSAVTGEGMKDLFDAVGAAAQEYHESYRPDLERRKAAKAEELKEQKEESLRRFESDSMEERVSEASKGDVLIGGDDDEESDNDSAEEVDADMDQVELRKVAEMLRGQDFE